MVVHKRLLIQPCTYHKLECVFSLFTFTVINSCFSILYEYMNMNMNMNMNTKNTVCTTKLLTA